MGRFFQRPPSFQKHRYYSRRIVAVAKKYGLSGAAYGAEWQQAPVNALCAEVTLLGHTGPGVDGDGMVGAGLDAGAAAGAGPVVYEHQAVGPFHHGIGWAGITTLGTAAVTA